MKARLFTVPAFLVSTALLVLPVSGGASHTAAQSPPVASAVSAPAPDRARVSQILRSNPVMFIWVATWGTPAAPGELSRPASIAFDSAGNVYVADTGNHRIQVFTPSGNSLWAFGRLGRGDGQFYNPLGIAVRGDRVYVADAHNSRVQVFTQEGTFVRQIGRWAGFDPGSLWKPVAVGIDALGKIYVLDPENYPTVQRFAPDGAFEKGYSEITCTKNTLAVSSTGDFYCVSYSSVYRVPASGAAQPIANNPSQPGYLRDPRQLAVAPDDSLWVYDLKSGLVNHYSPQGVYLSNFPVEAGVVALAVSDNHLLVLTGTPQVVTYDWSGNRLDAWGTPAVFQFDHPDRLAAASDGTLYVLERTRQRIQHLDGEGNVLAMFGPGLATQGNLVAPQDITVDALGRLYVLDKASRERIVRFADDRYDAAFNVSLYVPPRPSPFTAIAAIGDALLILNDQGCVLRTDLNGIRLGEWPCPLQRSYVDLAVTAEGRVYVVNQSSAPYVKAMTLLGAPLFSWGQSGIPDIEPGKFVWPQGIAADLRGRLFIVDTDNRAHGGPGITPTFSSRVQVFDEQGQYLAEWGSFGSQDGQFADPQSIAALPDGRIVIADTENNRLQVFAPDGPLPDYTPLPAPTRYDTPLPSINLAWQALGPVGGSAPYSLVFPPVVGLEQPIVATYGNGLLAMSTDGVHWTPLPAQLPGNFRRLDVWYAGGRTLIVRSDWADAPYRSTDGGSTWTRLGDAVAGGPLTIAPSPAFDTDGTLFGSAYGSGFWRSTDRGESWELRSLAGSALDRLALAEGPGGQRILLLADYTTSRLLRSTDDGLTWQPTGQSSAHAITFSPAFAQDQTVFALQSYKPEGGILRSTDGGVSWERLGTDTLPGGGSWAGLAISPNYPADHTLVAWSYSQAYLSTDVGHSWATFGPPAALQLHLVAFSPTYAQDHRIWRSEEGAGDRFTVTMDGGLTWQVAGDGMPGVSVLGLAGVEQTVSASVWAIAPNGLLTADGNGWSWLQTYEYARPQGSTALARSPAFAQDGTAIAFNAMTTDGGESWQPLNIAAYLEEARRSAAAFAPDFPQSRTIAVAWGSYTSAVGSTAVSMDGGTTWLQRTLPIGTPAVVVFDAAWPSVPFLYIGGEGGIARSGDLGQTWQAVEGPLAGLDVIGLADRMETERSVLYAATSTHGVWRSEDSGQTWVAFNAGLPSGHSCALAQAADLLAIGLCDGGVYVWQPHLAAWQRLGNRLPTRINGLLLQGSRVSGTIWAATDGGIYRTMIAELEQMPRVLLPLIISQR